MEDGRTGSVLFLIAYIEHSVTSVLLKSAILALSSHSVSDCIVGKSSLDIVCSVASAMYTTLGIQKSELE